MEEITRVIGAATKRSANLRIEGGIMHNCSICNAICHCIDGEDSGDCQHECDEPTMQTEGNEMSNIQGIGIHFVPYGTATFKPGTGRISPNAGYRYKSPEGTLWNADSVEGNHVQMWTVNAWGSTHRKSVHLADFARDWREVTA